MCFCVNIVEGMASFTTSTVIYSPAAPNDYEDRSYQVEFNVTTQSGTLVVYAEMDDILENDEDFKAMLSVPAGVARVFVGAPSEATVTILDKTAAEAYFDPDVYSVTEGQPANLILKLTTDVDPSVTILMFVNTKDGSGEGMYNVGWDNIIALMHHTSST